MPKLGDRCKKCKKALTIWIGALIGGTQIYECPECGNLQSGE
jgi:DNA-directed RNA polymerase subunit RPC12/RpoP